ncbi:MAG TPA: PIN domain-containing protein [Bryobacteraceae bacterium]|nr:PIN domain-containing protein [Bryobacteraceae bacterium]
MLAAGSPELVYIISENGLGEYLYGIRLSRHRARYERWLAEVIASCRVLEVDAGTAGHYAEVRGELKRSGRPIPANDLWIAALARQHASPLVSRDQHFDFVPRLKRVGW